MGLLEDAIREHLDLKRRRGADADEVAQAERDALGPPGRPTPLEETAAAALDPDEVPYEDDEGDFDDAYEPDEVPAEERLEPGEPTRLYDYGADDEAELVETELIDEEVEEAPVAAGDEPPEPVGAVRWEPGDDVAEVEDAAEPAVQGPIEPAPEDEPPVEEPAPQDEPPGEDREPPAATEGEEAEDVLEETPEFLQETPEHDRLWFEQKPPRDFDFGN